MAGLDEVLERLVTDVGFRRRLQEDPAAALEGYDLDEADLELLAGQLDDSGGPVHGVEQRTSKSALFGLLAGLQEPSVTGVDRPGAGRVFQAWVTVQNSSHDAPTELASGVEPDGPAADAPVKLGDISDGTSSTASQPPASREGLRNLAKPLGHPGEGPPTPKLQQSAVHGEDTAPEGHSDWIPLQAVGGEESAGGPVLEDVVVVREVDSAGEAHGTEATTGVGSDPAAGAEQAEAISRTSPDTVPEVTDEVQVGVEHDEPATPGGTNEIVLEDGRGREGAAVDLHDRYANVETSMPFAGDESG